MDMEAKALSCPDHTICYGDSIIRFSLHYGMRKTLAIHVYPNGAVVVDAPIGTHHEKIKEKIRKRAAWIRKQQAMFARLPLTLGQRSYVSGESFRYLGRQYRLKVEVGLINKVSFQRGGIYVYVTYNTPERVKSLLEQWFKERTSIVFAERFEVCKSYVIKAGIIPNQPLHIRSMKTRWGSCTKDGRISLNPELIAASKECIDYVITHELCHLKEHHHGKPFYDLLERVMPDWKARCDKLNGTVEMMEV
jgi:predicted metal-dependent hydrolase